MRRTRPKAPEPVSLQDYEEAARRQLPGPTFDFLAGGAADEITIRWNREAYDRLRLRPRALVDVSSIDMRVRLFGLDLPHPILLAPLAYQKLLHREGEIAAARGAAAAGALFVVSSSATLAVESIARSTSAPLWFQLYVQSDRGANRDLVARAAAAGCKALCVTVDTPAVGPRNREQRSGFRLPAHLTLPMNPLAQKARRTALSSSSAASSRRVSVTWKEIEEFLAMSSVPVLLKGVLHPDDAEQAVRLGVHGIIVSNHGGRNLDTALATIDALGDVAARVSRRIPVLVDGGIRRGTDVLKALALGASAVLIGRPYAYGLAVGGAEGVARVVTILRGELELAMALAGRPSISALDPSLLASSCP
jgi:4-hydroxymandelate oxidase